MSKRSVTMKAVPEFKELSKQIMTHRVMNGLSLPKEFSEREFTELMMKTQSINQVIGELKTKPKKR